MIKLIMLLTTYMILLIVTYLYVKKIKDETIKLPVRIFLIISSILSFTFYVFNAREITTDLWEYGRLYFKEILFITFTPIIIYNLIKNIRKRIKRKKDERRKTKTKE